VLIDSRTGVSDTSGICTVHMPDTLVICFTLNYQSIKGALAIAQSVREQSPKTRIFPLPTRIDGSEEKSLHRMKNYAAEVFSRFLDSEVDVPAYWYSMEVPYFARYAYAEKLSLFEDQSSISASTLPAMERLCGYLTNGDVRASAPLPNEERIAALAEFEGAVEAKAIPARQATPGAVSNPRATSEKPEKISTSPVRMFISHRPEDRAIAQAVAYSFVRLGTSINTFDSMDLNPGDSFREAAAAALRDAEFLLILIGDRTAGDYSTAYEVGYFSALIQDDLRRNSKTTRRIVSLNFSRSTVPTVDSVINIDFGITAEDLRKSPTEYLRSIGGTPEKDDALFRFYVELARTAQARLPFSDERVPDRRAIVEAFMPVREAVFESLQTRVARETVWNGFVDFEMSASASNESSIDPDTRLTMNERASAMFGFSTPEGGITWGELKATTWTSPSLLSALEQIVLDAISTTARVESERTVRQNRGPSLRVAPTRRRDHFDGRITIQINLIELPQGDTFGDRETSTLLGLIATSARYRDLFDRKGRFSVQAFGLARGKERFLDLTRQMMRQLGLIDELASEADITSSEALIRLFGNDEQSLSQLNNLFGDWQQARATFFASASKILDSSLQPSEFEAARAQLTSALEAFQRSTGLTSIVAVRALEVLNKTFRDELQNHATANPGQEIIYRMT
jgi:hypothetical protein